MYDESSRTLAPYAVSHENEGQPFRDIKIPLTSLSGHALTNGEVLNVPDASEDSRWNAEVDRILSYTTKSLLVIPLFSPGPERKPLAVISFLNKLDSGSVVPFSAADVETAGAFALFASLALDKSLLISKVTKTKNHLSILLEVMSYHLRAPTALVDRFMEEELPRITAEPDPLGIDDVDWDPHAMDDHDLVCAVFRMFHDLGLVEPGDARVFVQFLFTVGRNYRQRSDVPYHCFAHGAAVTHGLYILAKRFELGSVFDDVEVFSMLVACICHDLDHRGQSNAYQRIAQTPLFSLFTRSTMELLHANFAIKILSSEGHDVFQRLPSESYQRAIRIVKESIVATDLAVFFSNRAALKEALDSFDPATQPFPIGPGHDLRSALRGLILNACDLSSSYKPFPSARKTTALVYQEFFLEGAGIKKVVGTIDNWNMDADKEGQIPAMQVEFLDSVVLPIYELQEKVLPKASDLVGRVRANRDEWRRMVESGAEFRIS
ncbi:hypothetical protein DFJ74DRAFT_641518 [Hyaloraphidium curvatum]|nr:hypothetical protein DFJ74DRAFT_641518 [Hyaloraphidium curvatum]